MFVLLIEAFHVFLHKPKVTIRTMSMHNDTDVLQKNYPVLQKQNKTGKHITHILRATAKW